MATLSISISGSGLVNGTKSYTISDGDIQSLLGWAAANYATSLSTAPTNQQILLAWVGGWISATKNSVQQFNTPPAAAPPPIIIS